MPFRQAASNGGDQTNTMMLRRRPLNTNTPLFWSPPWHLRQLEIKMAESRLCSFVRLHVVHYLSGTGRSPVQMRCWSMPDRRGISIPYAQHASGFLKTPQLWTKCAFFLFSFVPSANQTFIVARRGKTCRHVSTV